MNFPTKPRLAARNLPLLQLPSLNAGAAFESPSIRLDQYTEAPATATAGAGNQRDNNIPNVSEIIENQLFLSDLCFAQDQRSTERYGITHVISIRNPTNNNHNTITGQVPRFITRNGEKIHYLDIVVDDDVHSEIISYFDKSVEFIQGALSTWKNSENKNHHRVLVHCSAGVSRSPTIVCAYLIRVMGWTARESLDYVKGKRRVTNPNISFVQQLNEYAGSLRGSDRSQGQRRYGDCGVGCVS